MFGINPAADFDVNDINNLKFDSSGVFAIQNCFPSISKEDSLVFDNYMKKLDSFISLVLVELI
jgi:hypothetical protein